MKLQSTPKIILNSIHSQDNAIPIQCDSVNLSLSPLPPVSQRLYHPVISPNPTLVILSSHYCLGFLPPFFVLFFLSLASLAFFPLDVAFILGAALALALDEEVSEETEALGRRERGFGVALGSLAAAAGSVVGGLVVIAGATLADFATVVVVGHRRIVSQDRGVA